MFEAQYNLKNNGEILKNSKTNSKQIDSKEQYYSKIKKNILELIIDNNNIYSKKIKRKNHSEPKSRYRLKKFQKKIKIKDNKRVSQKNVLPQEKIDTLAPNLNIEEDKKPTNNLKQTKNQQIKEKDINNKDKLNNKNIVSNQSNNNGNLNLNKRISKNSNDNININSYLLNNIDKSSNNDILNASSNNNSNNNLNLLNYYSNSNTNKSNTNYAFNFFGVNNNNTLEDNSSLNSSKNELSSKNVKLNNINNRISNLSSSSYGKNFVLKSEICKSTFHNENRYNKNTNSEDNPIMNYYNNDNKRKNFGNFYLFTDKKSTEEIDQNQYLNFFPIDDNDSRKKSKNIMSCNYIDNKIELPEQITTDIINENNENSNGCDFNLKEFHESVSDGDKLNLENIIKKKFMKGNINNYGSNSNLNGINTILEDDDNDNISDVKKDEFVNYDNNDINNNISNENNINNKIDFSLNNNNKESIINNDINLENKNHNENNINNSKMPLSFVNNIYNINNSHFKQFQINPIVNQGMPNFFYNQNINSNPMMNYFNSNFQPFNFYQQYYNEKNNFYPNNFFKSLNYQNNQKGQNNNNDNSINNNKMNSNNINFQNNNNINTNINGNVNINNKINNNVINNNIYNNFNNNNHLFGNKNFYEYSEEEILNLSIFLIKDQLGCRFMQEKIKSDHNFANELLFPKIKYNLKELCCDCFGNYFFQIMIDILSFDNINKFFDMTQNEFTEICISPHGTRVIQKIIDKISATPILMNRFIYNLNSKDLGVIFKSAYGNHMIQKFLETIHTSEYTNFIFNFVNKNFLDITNSKHGVCVVQKCVSEGDEKQREKLYDLILKNFVAIIKDQFGNYLIQYILINTKTEDKFKEIFPIILKIEENMVDLCTSKFSANVIEKCFENSENMIREHLLNSLLTKNSESIVNILLDQHGIYVIQKALKINNPNYKNKLIDIINSKEKELKNINFGDYKYKIILKTINSNKELGEALSKIIKKSNYDMINHNEKNNDNNNYNKGEANRNEYYNYNNRGKNKKGRKYYRGNNNKH